ncbi:MAG: hypothetical protein ACTS6A_00955 [Candidatus Hodgkinia cicadicola]
MLTSFHSIRSFITKNAISDECQTNSVQTFLRNSSMVAFLVYNLQINKLQQAALRFISSLPAACTINQSSAN